MKQIKDLRNYNNRIRKYRARWKERKKYSQGRGKRKARFHSPPYRCNDGGGGQECVAFPARARRKAAHCL